MKSWKFSISFVPLFESFHPDTSLAYQTYDELSSYSLLLAALVALEPSRSFEPDLSTSSIREESRSTNESDSNQEQARKR